MSDYIKRDDAIQAFDPRQRRDWYTPWIVETLEGLPSADVVPMERYKSMENTCVKLQKSLADVAPVVRCKDCRHAVDYYHEGDCYCSNPKWGLNYFGGSWEFYCADAERRNNE